ncbi:MAG: hypothetical protein NTW86_14885, partial [Candidatus Sumerlaeota bacterium]|nr:hypothetical protein [Candidatus Sumerlaeota bacterium]
MKRKSTLPQFLVGALFLLCEITPVRSAAEAFIYPKPPNLSESDAGQESSLYQVNVTQDGKSQPSFVYEIHADQEKPWRHNVCSFTTFSFDGSVTVEVTKLGGDPIQDCKIYPSSYQIAAKVISPTQASFTLDRPGRKIAVIFNEDWVTHPLLIFGDELEKDVPKEGDPNVLYYGPGVY